MDVCFPPALDSSCRVLILGSLPGRASLQAQQYYAHPRNQFWRLLGDILQQPLRALSYPERLARLGVAGVGLWDVVAAAERQGSLDAALRSVEHNDLSRLVATLPRFRVVAFNGATAARAQKQLLDQRCARLQLPSSSPAYTLGYDDKLAVWRELERYL